MGPAGFLAGWTLMMAAMMLPSIKPLVLLYRGPRVPLVVGYLAVWAGVGGGAVRGDGGRPRGGCRSSSHWRAAYELSPLKATCLRRCRGVVGFLMTRYRSGPPRLGVEHGAWCIGCCAGLMAVLAPAAAMGLGWAAVIAAVVFVQKVLPGGEAAGRATGVGLLAAGAVLAVV